MRFLMKKTGSNKEICRKKSTQPHEKARAKAQGQLMKSADWCYSGKSGKSRWGASNAGAAQ